MTTKELATIDTEVAGELEPLSEGQAKVLDKRVRQAGGRVTVEMDKLLELLKEAHKGQIHAALGFPSWLHYLKDAVGSLAWEDREQRKQLAQTLAGKMSNRAAAEMLGVTEGTIRNDLEGAQDSAPEKKTGRDGKEHPASKPPKDDNVIDAEVVDEAGDAPEERTPADVIESFAAEVDYLLTNMQAFKDILNDDAELFPKARKRIANRFLNRLGSAINDLQTVVDALME